MKHRQFHTSLIGLFVLISIVVSCDSAIVQKSIRENAESDGLTVILKEGVPREALEMDSSDLVSLLVKSSQSRSVTLEDENDTGITLDILYQASIARQDEYPFSIAFAAFESEVDPDMELMRLSDEQLRIIMEDFPDLQTEQEIYNNLDAIMGIYNLQKAYEIYDYILNTPVVNEESISRSLYEVIEYDENGIGSYEILGRRVNSVELTVLLSNPVQIPSYVMATMNAQHAEKALFNCARNGGDDQRDAMRHSLWNALIAQQCVFASRNYRMNFAEKITTAHEYGNDEPSLLLASTMDLHNNFVGRNLYENNSSGWWIFVIQPDIITFYNMAYQLAQNVIVCTTVEEINNATSDVLVALKVSTPEEIALEGTYYGSDE